MTQRDYCVALVQVHSGSGGINSSSNDSFIVVVVAPDHKVLGITLWLMWVDPG